MLPMLCLWWWLAPWYSPGCLTHIPNCLAGSPHGHITGISNSSLSPPQIFYVSKQHHCLPCPDTRDILESSPRGAAQPKHQEVLGTCPPRHALRPSITPAMQAAHPVFTACQMAVVNPGPVPLPPLQSVLGQQPVIMSLPCLKAFAGFSLS